MYVAYIDSKLCYTDIFRLQELLRRFHAFPEIAGVRQSYVPSDVKLYLTLWALSNQDSFRAIGDIVREPMTKRFFFLPRKVWVHFWNREPMVVTGSPVWLGAVGAFRSYRLPNSAGIDILSPNFLIHHFNTQNRELKVVSIPEGPDRIYGAVC
jgi:hypothetical protein